VGVCPVTLETRPHQGHDQIFQMKRQPYFRRLQGIYIYTLIYVHIYMYVHVCVYIRIFIYISIYMYIHILYRVLSIPCDPSQVIARYVYTYISICIYIYTCICVYIYVYSYMYIYIHAYMISCVMYSLQFIPSSKESGRLWHPMRISPDSFELGMNRKEYTTHDIIHVCIYIYIYE